MNTSKRNTAASECTKLYHKHKANASYYSKNAHNDSATKAGNESVFLKHLFQFRECAGSKRTISHKKLGHNIYENSFERTAYDKQEQKKQAPNSSKLATVNAQNHIIKINMI